MEILNFVWNLFYSGNQRKVDEKNFEISVDGEVGNVKYCFLIEVTVVFEDRNVWLNFFLSGTVNGFFIV